MPSLFSRAARRGADDPQTLRRAKAAQPPHDCLTLTINSRGEVAMNTHLDPATVVAGLRQTAAEYAAARGLADEPQPVTPEQPDTFPAWLYQRFAHTPNRAAWADLSESDRAYWAHEAAAVRRAVARDGFKTTGGNPA